MKLGWKPWIVREASNFAAALLNLEIIDATMVEMDVFRNGEGNA